jgi:hypothetical protein
MSGRRQVLQEAEKALEPFVAIEADKDRLKAVLCALSDAVRGSAFDRPDTIDAWHWFCSSCLAARSTHALIRASLAAGDPPETMVTEAMVDAAVTEWRSWCRAMPPTFVDNHPRDGIRRALQAALTAKEQA